MTFTFRHALRYIYGDGVVGVVHGGADFLYPWRLTGQGIVGRPVARDPWRVAGGARRCTPGIRSSSCTAARTAGWWSCRSGPRACCRRCPPGRGTRPRDGSGRPRCVIGSGGSLPRRGRGDAARGTRAGEEGPDERANPRRDGDGPGDSRRAEGGSGCPRATRGASGAGGGPRRRRPGLRGLRAAARPARARSWAAQRDPPAGRDRHHGRGRSRSSTSTTGAPTSTASSCSCRCPRRWTRRASSTCVHPAKDVDGFHPENVGRLVQKRARFVPCTPAGIMELLTRHEIEVAGRRAVVIGRSDIVGKPMALLLMHADATVTVCHSRTRRPRRRCTREADILVAAIGTRRLRARRARQARRGGGRRRDEPGEDRSRRGSLLVPARFAEFERKGHALVGDVHAPSVLRGGVGPHPVPGGVGPLTIALLLSNTVRAAAAAAALRGMLRVGLTGGIACGKSHVLRRLAGHGLQTLDLDAVARDVTAPGSPALQEISGAFGAGVLGPDGSLDRAALAALVFADAAARARLNAIVHPRVRAEEARRAEDVAGRGAAVLVTDAALLVEAGAHLRFDRLVVVHCDPGQQLERLRARDGLDEGAARARVLAQMPRRGEAVLRALRGGHVGIDRRHRPGGRRARRAAGRSCVAAAAGRSGVGLDALVGGLVHGPERRTARALARSPCSRPRPRRGAWRWKRSPRGSRRPRGGPGTGRRGRRSRDAPATRLSVALAAWALRRGGARPGVPRGGRRLGRAAHPHRPGRARRRVPCCARRAGRRPRPRAAKDVGGQAESLSPLAAAVRGRGAVRTAPSGPGGGPPSSARPRGRARRVRAKGRRRRPGRGARRPRRRRSSRRPRRGAALRARGGPGGAG